LNSWLQSSVGGGLPANALRLWRLVADASPDREYRTPDLAKLAGASPRSVARWARALVDANLWVQTSEPGEKPLRFKPVPGKVPEEVCVLPDLDAV
jgi:hypothetical protein